VRDPKQHKVALKRYEGTWGSAALVDYANPEGKLSKDRTKELAQFLKQVAYTDPTGMFSFRQALGFAIAVVGTILAPQGGGTWAKLGYAIAIGFASGYVATGTFRGGVIGAFTAAVAFGVAGLDLTGRVAFQGMAGGIVEGLSGGKFGHGFFSAGLTTAVMPQVGHADTRAGRTALGAVLGGTLSVATGGKFANGAVSGAIQGAMARSPEAEGELSLNQDSEFLPATGTMDLAIKAIREADAALRDAGAYRVYSNRAELEETWRDIVEPIALRNRQIEIASWIYKGSGGYVMSGPFSTGDRSIVRGIFDVRHLKGVIPVALIHNHPNSPVFSGINAWYSKEDGFACQGGTNCWGDVTSAYRKNIDVVMVHNGTISRFDQTAFRNAVQAGGYVEFKRYVTP
jgi:hypothetical protein